MREQAKGRLLALDGLRGYAAMSVVVYHAILFFIAARASALLATPIQSVASEDRLAKALVVLFDGELAVMLFFAMSGAVLLRALGSDVGKVGLVRSLALFPLKRVLRIYPALIVCLLAMGALYWAAHAISPTDYPAPSWKHIGQNCLLYETPAHGATWTLRAEMLAIPFIVVAFLARRLLGISGLAAFLVYSLLLMEFPRLGLGVWLVQGWLLYFAAGFLAHDLSRSNVVVELMKGYRWIGVCGALLVLRAVLPQVSPLGTLLRLGCITVLVAYMFSEHQNALKAHLSSRIPVFFGRISYSLYLWNVVFMNLLLIKLFQVEFIRTHYAPFGLLLGVLVILISIPVSMLSERWIERPCSSILRTGGSALKRPEAPEQQRASARPSAVRAEAGDALAEPVGSGRG